MDPSIIDVKCETMKLDRIVLLNYFFWRVSAGTGVFTAVFEMYVIIEPILKK